MSQTKVAQVSKTPEGSQAEGCDSTEKEKTEGERMDTNDRSRSSQDPCTSNTDRDQDRRGRCGMQKEVGRYTLQCNDTHMLQTLGFKEHCEQRFVNHKLELEFDHASGLVVLHTPFNFGEEAKDLVTNFEKNIELFLAVFKLNKSAGTRGHPYCARRHIRQFLLITGPCS